MPDKIRLTIKLTPKASHNSIKGWAENADGHKILKVSVTAVPEKGKANKALIGLLAGYFGLPKRTFSIVRGETDRLKVIDIIGLSEDEYQCIVNMKN